MTTPIHTPQSTGSSEALTWSSFASGLWLRPERQRLCRFTNHLLGSGHPRLRSLYCRKAPIGVGHALFVLSEYQLTRIFHSANNALCCAAQIVCCQLVSNWQVPTANCRTTMLFFCTQSVHACGSSLLALSRHLLRSGICTFFIGRSGSLGQAGYVSFRPQAAARRTLSPFRVDPCTKGA